MVTWSDPAKQDLRHIHDYIAQDSRFYAKKVTQDLIDKTKILSQHPQIGKIVPEVNQETIRELSLYSYRILYEIRQNDIVILAVIHKRRDFSGGEESND